MNTNRPNVSVSDDTSRNWLQVVGQHVESLRFGTVQIIVHDGRVIQVEKTERFRFEKSSSASHSVSANPSI